MKLSTLILSTIILFLAIKPGIDLISLQNNNEQTCCDGQSKSIADNEKSSSQQKQKDDRSGKSCNPFQVCSSCVLQCFKNQLTEISKPEISTNQNFTYQSVFTSQFAPDFWQPPKIV
ncbi:hypothetical protein E0I61_05595 [Flavobacterium ranwuense]|uniref:Uncharacterized protein n=1 Tax=Flavobacterium ranwuense TaxID=2541725 RepID=A0ABY2DWG9_9FLAO|nr:hypothetical protein [Flavobacterium ranwuense]TDE30470.1 hypothetical protein E0I61_05595 [Flavobacterium ranwuense]